MTSNDFKWRLVVQGFPVEPAPAGKVVVELKHKVDIVVGIIVFGNVGVLLGAPHGQPEIEFVRKQVANAGLDVVGFVFSLHEIVLGNFDRQIFVVAKLVPPPDPGVPVFKNRLLRLRVMRSAI